MVSLSGQDGSGIRAAVALRQQAAKYVTLSQLNA
jgi:hypothetical protein